MSAWTRYRGTCLVLAGALLLGAPEAAYACTNCISAAPASPVTHGILLAMLLLVGTTGFIWSGIGMFFFNMHRRARLLEPGRMVVTEQGTLRPSPEDERAAQDA